MCPIDGPEDAPFGAAIRTDRRYLDQHLVAVHRISDEGWRNEDVARKIPEAVAQRLRVGQDEPIAVAMHAQASDDHVLASRSRGQGVPVRVDLDELAAADQAVEAILEIAARFAAQPEFSGQLFVSRGALGLLADFLEDR